MLLTKLKSTSVLLLVASFVLAGAGTCLHVLRAEFNPSNQPEELTPVTVHERFDSTPAENSQDGEPKEQPAKETKVQSLLKERLAVLRELAEELKEQSKKGTVSPLPAMRANQQVFKAELELCETAKERVAVLEKGVETAKELEKLVASHVESGALPKGNLQSARVERLDAEIALEREKAKLSPPK
jgi:hypothetical protein